MRLWLHNRKLQWKDFWSTNMILKIHLMNQNISATILIWLKSHPCIWMLWFTLKITSILLCLSEDHAERVFVGHALWTVMDFTPLLVSDKSIETLPSPHLSLHWVICLFLRILLSIWPISIHNTKPLNLIWKEKILKLKE